MATTPGELGTAADTLRVLTAAVGAPDKRDQAFHADGTDITQGRRPGMYDVATTQTPELARFIAAMGPAVGVAVADWLGCMAMLDPAERGGDECGWCGIDHALTIARTVNGTTR
jgi:hypothetical protein